jgi:pimeloyl-ACP methyl ester carboxylesterase
MLHPRALLDLHNRENAQGFGRVCDDFERRGRLAREHAPASLQLLAHGSVQRITVRVEVIAGRDDVAVQRTRPCATKQRQRIGPAVKIDRYLAQPDQIGATGHPAQRGF